MASVLIDAGANINLPDKVKFNVVGAPNLYSGMCKPHYEICGYYCCDSGRDN